MMESEFKKRIQSRIDKQKSESKCPDAVENSYVHQVYIDSLIDEAKREFPDWHKEAGVIADELSTETVWRNCLRKLREIDVWIEKWFGDTDKIPP